MFKCGACKSHKPKDDFHKDRSRKGGVSSRCKLCANKIRKEHYKQNKEKSNITTKKYYLKHKEEILKYRRTYNRGYKNPNPPSVQAKLANNLRSRLSAALKNNYKTGSAVDDLGCSMGHFQWHLESNFQPGMAWENYGRKGWHIDHIVPLKNFDLTDRQELLQACHYTNLQPLWWHENIVKDR